MSRKRDAHLEPISIDANTWAYVTKRELEIIHQVRNGSGFIQTDHILLPWRIVEKALAVRLTITPEGRE